MTKRQYDKIMNEVAQPGKAMNEASYKFRAVIIREAVNNWPLLVVLYLAVIMIVPPILKSIWGIE